MKTILQKLSSVFKPGPKKTPAFVSVLSDYLKKEIIQNKLSKSTEYKYAQIESNIRAFLRSEGLSNIDPAQFKIKIADKLLTWLHANLKSCGKTHSARHIEMCMRVMDHCVKEEYIYFNPLASMEVKRDRVKEIIQLEKQEIASFRLFIFASEILRRAADLYLFQCYTGLSYADLSTYKIVIINGREWFCNAREKNKNTYWLPVFSEARRILDKYEGNLPRFTNGAYNRFLKEIAVLLNIQKHLTTHTARKTFATLLHDAGYSNEAIKDMLGQVSTRTTETHYIRINRNRVKNELELYRPLPPAA